MSNPRSIQEAREQAADYFGFTASVKLRVGDELFEIPNPGLLDDDQQERWDELQFELQYCDREPDVERPEREIENPDGTKTTVPAHTIKGDYIKPYQKTVNGETKLLKPSYNTRLAMVIFGDRYEKFKAAGGSGSQIAIEWARMNDEYQKRVEEDPKSGGSAATLEVVRESD